jgi:hypothetical protein
MHIESTLIEVSGIGQNTVEKLRECGIGSVVQLAAMEPEKLAKMKGFGPASAKKLIDAARTFLKQKDQEDQKIEETLNPLFSGKQQNTDQPSSQISAELFGEDFPEEDIEEDPSFVKEEIFQESSAIYTAMEHLSESPTLSNEWKIPYAPSVAEVLHQERKKTKLMKEESKSPTNRSPQNIKIEPKIEQKTVKLAEPGDTLPVMTYEKHLYVRLNGEKLDPQEILSIEQHLTTILKAAGYHTIPHTSTILRTISDEIDLLTIKIIPINALTTLIHICPIKISLLRGSFIVREDALNYEPLNHEIKFDGELENIYFRTPIQHFINKQSALLQHILSEETLLLYLKKLVKGGLSIYKTRSHRPLYIHCEGKECKIIIDPILITFSEPKFLEKSLKFAYQRSTNLHIVSYTLFDKLVDYFHKKYFTLESREETNSIINYRDVLNKIYSQLKQLSVPFTGFGIILLFMMLFADSLVLETFIRLGTAALGIYIIVLGFFYLTYFKSQKEICERCTRAYFKNIPHIDENDLIILRDELSTDTLDQMIYECVGKQADFSVMAKIEQEKAQQLDEELMLYHEHEENIVEQASDPLSSSGSEEDSLRKKMVSKYSKFLEE